MIHCATLHTHTPFLDLTTRLVFNNRDSHDTLSTNEKAMLSISIHRCQNCLTLQERLMLAPENGHLSFNGKLQKNNLFPTHPYQVSGQRTAVSGARNNT